MTLVNVLLVIALWYLIGIIGSGIGFSSMDRDVYYSEKTDRLFGLLFAIAGPVNVIIAIVLSLIHGNSIKISMRWLLRPAGGGE